MDLTKVTKHWQADSKYHHIRRKGSKG